MTIMTNVLNATFPTNFKLDSSSKRVRTVQTDSWFKASIHRSGGHSIGAELTQGN